MNRDPSPAEIAKMLGCTQSEIAFCMDVNCEPEEYACVDRTSTLDALSPGFENY